MNKDQLLGLLLNYTLGRDKIPEIIAFSSPIFERRPVLFWHPPKTTIAGYTIQISKGFTWSILFEDGY